MNFSPALLRNIRTAAKLGQEDVARRTGVSRSAVAQWETGRADPTAKHLGRLACLLGVNVNDFYSNDGVTTMSFAIRDLSVLAYANGFTLWHYKGGAIRLFDIGRVGFFNDAADMMAAGDMIMTSANDGATVFCVAEADAGRVIIVPLSDTRVPQAMAAE